MTLDLDRELRCTPLRYAPLPSKTTITLSSSQKHLVTFSGDKATDYYSTSISSVSTSPTHQAVLI